MTETDSIGGSAVGVDAKPVISIIMPTFNSSRFLAPALCSVLQQDFLDFELLVVDDHSTDDSAKIAREFACNDSRVQCLTNRRSKGVSGARNTGLDNARGEWITFLDSDDLLTDSSFSTRMEFLTRTPSCKILTADHSYIDEGGAITIERRFASVGLTALARKSIPTQDRDFCLETPVAFFLDEFCLMLTGSALLHRSVIDRVGRFDETMTHGEDTKYWFQAALHDSVFFLDFVSMDYRQSSASATADTRKVLQGRETFYRKLRDDPDFLAYRVKATRRLAMAISDRAYYFRTERHFRLAALHAIRSLLVLPTLGQAWRNLLGAMLRRP